MLRQAALLAAALLPFSLAQVSQDFSDGWDETTWPIFEPDCSGSGNITLDSSNPNNGTASLKVTSGPASEGFCGHIFFGTTQVPSSGDVYVRFYFKLLNPIPADHCTYISMPDTGQGTDELLHIGGQDGVVDWNRESDDINLPDLGPQGVAASTPLATGSFQCFEYHIGTDGTIQTWINSTLYTALSFGPNITNPYSTGWADKTGYIPHITAVYFGWESYSGDVNTIWYNDIVIASSRIGC